MIFSFLKKSPSGAARHLLPEAEKKSAATPSVPLPVGERVDRAKRETGEGAFQAGTCVIWNDIQRALETR